MQHGMYVLTQTLKEQTTSQLFTYTQEHGKCKTGKRQTTQHSWKNDRTMRKAVRLQQFCLVLLFFQPCHFSSVVFQSCIFSDTQWNSDDKYLGSRTWQSNTSKRRTMLNCTMNVDKFQNHLKAHNMLTANLTSVSNGVCMYKLLHKETNNRTITIVGCYMTLAVFLHSSLGLINWATALWRVILRFRAQRSKPSVPNGITDRYSKDLQIFRKYSATDYILLLLVP